MAVRSCIFLGILWSLLLCVKSSSVCVARLHSGDVFVNEGGAIAACAEYGAICALGDELGGAGAAEGDGLQCACDVSEILVPCPACKCNTIYPLFNGTSCEGERVLGWKFRNDLIDPHLNHSQALAMDKAFSYPTKVYGWKMRVKNSRSKGGWMLLQVWRPKVGGFDLIASTNFSYRPSRGSGYTDTELPLSEDEWIPIEQGDIIGLFLVNGIKKSAAPVAFGLLSGSAISSGMATASSSDMLFFSSQDPPTELRTVDYDEHTDHFVINVQAMIGPPVEGEKQCLAEQVSVETIVGGDITPTPSSNHEIDLQLILAPLVFTLLFIILLILGTSITFFCVRMYRSSQRKKEKREREQRGSITLDTMDRRSVNNSYPPLGLGSLPRCGVTTGSCADSIYEAIPDLVGADRFTTSYSGSLGPGPHTYATLECPPLYTETCANGTCANMVSHFQVQEDIQTDPDKSEKHLSTKDELTGQESEKISEQSVRHTLVATETSAQNGDHPQRLEVEHQEELETGGDVEEGVSERETEREWEEVSGFDSDEDSDHGLKIYNV